MNPYLQGEVTLTYIRGGVSAKTNNPYLQVSNGRKEFFITIPKGSGLIQADSFSAFDENDEITLSVKIQAGSENVVLVSL